MSNYSFYLDAGDGEKKDFSFNFTGQGYGYLRESDIEVYVDGIEVGFTLTYANPNNVTLLATPADGAVVLIRRTMPKDVPFSKWDRGNDFSPVLVNSNFLQLQYTVHEILDGFLGEGFQIQQNLDMNYYRIVNLGAPNNSNDAVRLIDLQGGDGGFTATRFNDGSAYVLLDNALPEITSEGVTRTKFNVKLLSFSGKRTLVGEGEDGIKNSSLSINTTSLIATSITGVETTVSISELGLPVNQFIDITLEGFIINGEYSYRLMYNEIYSDWVVDSTIKGAWRKFFGYGNVDSGIESDVAYVTHTLPSTLAYEWSYARLDTFRVVCTINTYSGSIIGDAYEGSEPDVGISVTVNSTDTSFDPLGTGYPSTAQTVDAVLRNIDTNFVRYSSSVSDPDVPDGTPLVAYRPWMVDTSTSPRNRPLPSAPKDADTILVRDDTGNAGTNNITVGRNGKTIMGLAEDIKVTTNYTWFEIQYFAETDDWRVIAGGVGAQVKIVDEDILNFIYPVGCSIRSRNANNPASYWGIGTWVRGAVGMGLSGIGISSGTDGTSRAVVSGENEGAWEVKLEIANMPNHSHPTNSSGGSTSSSNKTSLRNEGGTDALPSTAVQAVGGDEPFSIITPTDGYYVWDRIE